MNGGITAMGLDCWVFFGQCLFSCFRLPSLIPGVRVRPRSGCGTPGLSEGEHDLCPRSGPWGNTLDRFVLVKPRVLWRRVYLVPVVAGCDCSWRWRSGAQAASCSAGGAPMWCVKRRWVVSWLVGGRRGCGCGSWRAGSGCGGGPGRGRPGPRRFALVAFALVVGPGDGVGAQGGEGGQEHGALEPLVAAVGDAPCHGSMSRSGV